MIDTGSTYTLMKEDVWQKLKKSSIPVLVLTPQRFIMADGTIHQSRDLQKKEYQWHDKECNVNTFKNFTLRKFI